MVRFLSPATYLRHRRGRSSSVHQSRSRTMLQYIAQTCNPMMRTTAIQTVGEGKGRRRWAALRARGRRSSARPTPSAVERRPGADAARADECGEPSPTQTAGGPPGGSNCVASNHQRAHGGARTLSKGVKKLSSNFRILTSALARACGSSCNTSRVKVSKGICVQACWW